jgi:hypothetical protein
MSVKYLPARKKRPFYRNFLNFFKGVGGNHAIARRTKKYRRFVF